MLRKIFLAAKKLFYWIDSILLKLPIVRKHLYLRQLSKFVIAGGIFTIVDFAVYIVLTRFFLFWQIHYLWANFTGMFVGAVGNFILNKKWTFQDREKRVVSQYIKFWLIAALGGMLLYQLLMTGFVEVVNLYDILAKALAAIITLFFRFGIQKFWIFK